MYHRLIGKSIIGEWGLVLSTGEHWCYGTISENIAQRQWGGFYGRPEHGWAGLVRKFYVNIINRRGFIIRVRGTDVNFDTHTINELYNLPNYTLRQYEYVRFLSETIDEWDIIRTICHPDVGVPLVEGRVKHIKHTRMHALPRPRLILWRHDSSR